MQNIQFTENTYTQFEKLNNLPQFIKELRNRFNYKETINIAFLGYTDIMLNSREWASLGINEKELDNRENWKRLTAIHGRNDVQVVPTLTSVLKALIGNNFNLTIFDFTKYEGSEIEWDFNFEITDEFVNKFDIIIDSGTCEHIFNLPQALININKMLKINGIVWHGGPLCWPNHGFYGYNPTLFADFYEDNGCQIIEMFLRASLGNQEHLTISKLPKYERFKMSQVLQNNPKWLALEYNLLVFVKKIKECSNTIYPIQRKYRETSVWQ